MTRVWDGPRNPGTNRGRNARPAPYNARMQQVVPTLYQRYQPWRRGVEAGFWVVQYLVSALANSITVNMDVRRLHLGFSAWQPVVWETSSALVALALVPAVVWFTRRFPLRVADWRRLLALHLLGSNAQGELLAYARLLPAGKAFAEASVGRVLTRASARTGGLGHALMHQALAHLAAQWGAQPVRIGAQAHLQPFYAQHGFVDVGLPYIEDGIPHLEMLRA